MWHSIRNQDDRPPLGEVVIFAYFSDKARDGETEGVFTNEGFRILDPVPYDKFLRITDWKRKDEV